MSIGRIVTTVLATLALSGCVGVLSHSYSYVGIDTRPTVSDSDWTTGFLHLGEPLIENIVIDLTHKLETTCAGAGLSNLQTKLTLREFVLVQIYSVRLTGSCASGQSRPVP